MLVSSPWTVVRLLFCLGLHVIAAQSIVIMVSSGGLIQDALDAVSPGDTIHIEAGHYFEDLKTKVDGTAGARITIRGAIGTDRSEVVLRGTGEKNRVFEVKHDYYVIEEFTIDGQAVDNPQGKSDYRDQPLFVTSDRLPTRRQGGYLSALDGLIVRHMIIKNAGGECIRLRYFVTNTEISDNRITDCGLYAFVFNAGGKNGEGIYIGTSSQQWDDGKNPSDDPDVCLNTLVTDNYIETKGNEGVDVKEGCEGTVIENNHVIMQLDDDSGGIGSRADGSIIRNNHIEDAEGAGVRLGGHEVDGYQYGVNNEVYGNTMVDCRSYGVKIMASPQAVICGNKIELPPGETERSYKYVGGTYDEDYDPRELCPDSLSPTPVSDPTPAPVAVPDGLVDVGNLANVETRATSYDERGVDEGGCDPDGCQASLTRDSSLSNTSRWSCRKGLTGDKCKLKYKFSRPGDVKKLRISYYKGDERTRSIKVKTWSSEGARKAFKYTSSGDTRGFEDFELDAPDTVKMTIFPITPNENDWISFTEVMIMVDE